MQAAFVDIGLERAAFIHAAEISNREGSAVESIEYADWGKVVAVTFRRNGKTVTERYR